MGFLKSFYDYMFYRTYRVYAKYDDIPRFNSTSLLAVCTYNITFFIPPSISDLFRSWSLGGKIIFLSYFLLMFVYFFRKYNKKRIADITRKYARNKWNKKIPAWIFILYLPISFAIGLSIYVWIKRNIIRPYGLEDYIYNLFVE